MVYAISPAETRRCQIGPLCHQVSSTAIPNAVLEKYRSTLWLQRSLHQSNHISQGVHVFKFSFLIVGILFSIIGCERSFRGEPASSIVANRDVLAQSVNVTLSEQNIIAAMLPSATAEERNRIIFARMAEIDALYYTFERELSLESRQSDLITSLAALAAGIGGTIATSSASRVFSAGSAAIAGVQTNFNEKILLDRTIQALTSQMRGARNIVKAQILGRLQASPTVYPLTSALADLELYRQAGTLPGAVIGISQAAAATEQVGRTALIAAEQRIRITQVERVAQPRREQEQFVRPSVERLSVLIGNVRRILSDQQIIDLANNPPAESGERFRQRRAFLLGNDTEFQSADFARRALEQALAVMDRNDATLTAWEKRLQQITGSGGRTDANHSR